MPDLKLIFHTGSMVICRVLLAYSAVSGYKLQTRRFIRMLSVLSVLKGGNDQLIFIKFFKGDGGSERGTRKESRVLL